MQLSAFANMVTRKHLNKFSDGSSAPFSYQKAVL